MTDIVLWKDMTPEQKGALLLASHENKDVQVYSDNKWVYIPFPKWENHLAYRVAPNPQLVVIKGELLGNQFFTQSATPNLKISFYIIDGEPDYESIEMTAIERD